MSEPRDPKSRDFQARAHRAIPGGAHTYSRGDDTYPENAPPVLSHGKGAWVWDADGNRFLDFVMGLRSVTVGYAYQRIADAAIREILKGNAMPRPSTTEVEAAEALIARIPGAEMVKFAKNGSTVTTAAVKLARAFTGRELIARCAEHPFFSYDDWFIGSTVVTSGVPDDIRRLTLQFHYNDISSCRRLFDEHPGQIACFILEPSTVEPPARGAGPDGNFLTDLKKLCADNGCLLVADEMITGFRWDARGACALYGVTPDLVTFGKGMANGFSVAALAGRRDVMELGGISHTKPRVFLTSTTHGAEMCGLGAFLETLRVYDEHDVVGHHWRVGRLLTDEINGIARTLGIADHFVVGGVPCSPVISMRDREKKESLAFRTLWGQEMVKRGVLMGVISLCLEHGEEEVAFALAAARESLAVYRRALDDGIERHLEGRPIKPVFRPFN